MTSGLVWILGRPWHVGVEGLCGTGRAGLLA
jgi:hypothetical protein